MTIPGETNGGTETTCTDCKETLHLEVLSSAAGHYLGYSCNCCGPYSRESGYYSTEAEAQEMLKQGNPDGRP